MAEIDTRQNAASNEEDSFRDKCMRELQLGAAAAEGIGHELLESVEHPTTRLPEVATGLAFGTAMGVLTHGRFGLGGVLASAAGAMFAKQLLTDGGNVLGAATDAWQSPSGFQHDREVVSHTIGNFTADTTAFALGGFGGSRIGRIAFRVPSAAANISYETAGSAPRSFQFAESDARATTQDLQRLLGVDDLRTLKGAKTNVDTKYGATQLRSYFSDSQQTLRIDFEGTRSASTPRLEVRFDAETGRATGLKVHDDPAHFIPSLMDITGNKALSMNTGLASGEFVLSEKFGRLDAAQSHERLQALKQAQTEDLPVQGVAPVKDVTMVPQKSVRTAPLSEPLGTTNITTCSALVIIDEAGGKHLLAHADALTNPDLLRRALSSFDLTRAKIYIMEGESNFFSPQLNLMGSAERLLTALGDDPAVMKNVRFVRYGGSNQTANLVSHKGKLYADAASWVQSG